MPGSTPPDKKIILITGCSSGFGLLTAARLASRGHQVIATMRNLDKQGPLQDEVRRRQASVDVRQLDVTDPKSIAACMKDVGEEYGRIDVLINNAGFGMAGFFEDLTQEEIRAQFETNFFGVQNVTRAVIPFMRPQGWGKIINLSSVSGFSASPAFGAYCASKWALEAFSEALRYELRLFGIDVHLIEPGTYRTKIFDENARRAKNFANPESPYFVYSSHLDKLVKDHVADCHKDPEDIAALAEKIINSCRAPFRNIPDIETQFMAALRKVLPFRAYSWLVNRAVFGGIKPTPPAAA